MPVDFLELQDLVFETFKRFRPEEIRRLINRPEYPSFIAADNRRELIKVAKQHHLHSAERHGRFGTVQAQEHVDAVEKISPHHGNFVDDQRFEFGV